MLPRGGGAWDQGTEQDWAKPVEATTGSLSRDGSPPGASGTRSFGSSRGGDRRLALVTRRDHCHALRMAGSVPRGRGSDLKNRTRDAGEEGLLRLRAKIGEMTMANGLLPHRCHRVEAGLPLARRRRSA